MYVYVSNKWNIILKTMNRKIWIQNKYREYIVNYQLSDNLIFEWWQVIKYENSQQYIEDTNRYHLTKELDRVKRENKDMEIALNKKIKWEIKKARADEITEYDKKLYILKNKRW